MNKIAILLFITASAVTANPGEKKEFAGVL
jgi:hypothetical protein